MASETIRPDADVAIGSWTDDGGGTTDIFQSIDEATASDTDFIKTENNPVNSSCEIGFAAPTDTTPFHGRLSYRYRKQGGRTADLTVQLKKGTQVVQSWSHADIGTPWVQADQVITAEIDDWSDIRVVFIGNQVPGGPTTTVEVSWSEGRTAVVKSIGTGKDYTTGTAWEAAIDNTTYPDTLTVAEGQGYNEAFDESVIINAAPTNVIGTVLTAASGNRHDGTDGSGARIVRGAFSDGFLIRISAPNVYVNWWEFDANQTNPGVVGDICTGGESAGQSVMNWRNLVVHGARFASSRSVGIVGHVNDNGTHVTLNCFVYDIVSPDNRDAIGIVLLTSFTRNGNVENCTVHDISTSSDGDPANCFSLHDASTYTYRNNIGTDASNGGTFGQDCFTPTSFTNATVSNNLSSDASASGTGSLVNKASANQFVSNAAPYDLHLVTGADAKDAGTDLGVSPAGVNLDIDGRDRDAQADTWDMGADEFVLTGINPTGIATSESFGSAQLNSTLFPSSVSTTEAFGTHVLTGFVDPTGIATSEAFGTAQLNAAILPTGIITEEAFGTAALNVAVFPSAAHTGETIGSHELSSAGTISPTGIATLQAFGLAQLNALLAPAGIASAEAFGTALLKAVLAATGIASGESVPSPQLDVILTATPAETGESVGSLSLGAVVVPSGIASAETVNSPAFQALLSPAGIASLQAIGAQTLNVTLVPSPAHTGETFGSAVVSAVVVIVPAQGWTLDADGVTWTLDYSRLDWSLDSDDNTWLLKDGSLK